MSCRWAELVGIPSLCCCRDHQEHRPRRHRSPGKRIGGSRRVGVCGAQGGRPPPHHLGPSQEALHWQYLELLRLLNGEGDSDGGPWGGVFIGRDDGRLAGEGCAVLFLRAALVPAGPAAAFWLSDSPDRPGSVAWGAHLPRMALSVPLRRPPAPAASAAGGGSGGGDDGWRIRVFNTHLDHESPEARRRGAALVLARMREAAAEAGGAGAAAAAAEVAEVQLLCGDMNEGPGDAAVEVLRAGLVDAQARQGQGDGSRPCHISPPCLPPLFPRAWCSCEPTLPPMEPPPSTRGPRTAPAAAEATSTSSSHPTPRLQQLLLQEGLPAGAVVGEERRLPPAGGRLWQCEVPPSSRPGCRGACRRTTTLSRPTSSGRTNEGIRRFNRLATCRGASDRTIDRFIREVLPEFPGMRALFRPRRSVGGHSLLISARPSAIAVVPRRWQHTEKPSFPVLSDMIDPLDVPSPGATSWKGVRRFYNSVGVQPCAEEPGFWEVLIEGRVMRTNAMNDLRLPSEVREAGR